MNLAALRRPCAVALTIVLVAGCDSTESTVAPGSPTMTIVATHPCGRNLLPLPTMEELAEGRPPAIQVIVRGTDPSTSTSEFVSGTAVEIFMGDEPDASARGGRFQSSCGDDDGCNAVSSGITFSGSQARDEFFCLSVGEFPLSARVTEYQPGGDGEPQTVRTARNRSFPVRCVSRADFARECPEHVQELGMLDFAVDASDFADVPDAQPDSALPSWSVACDPIDPEVAIIGIRGSGGRRTDNVQLNFRVSELEVPLSGVKVGFSLSDNPPLNVALSADEALSDAQGKASVRLLAGGTPGVVTVTAIAEREYPATTPEGGCQSDEQCEGLGERACRDTECVRIETQEDTCGAVTIRGGIPSHRGMQMVCECPMMSAFSDRVEGNGGAGQPDDRWLMGNEPGTDCQVQIADRINGRIEEGTPVFFLTEAGTVLQSSNVDADGRASTHLRVGLPAPMNVDPILYPDYEQPEGQAEGIEDEEPTYGPDDEYNPRDGLVRLVAFTRGEEDFRDTNGNNIFDENVDVLEEHHDLSDPYIDADDDGRYDVDVEVYRDGDADGDFTDPDGEWNNNIDIWTSTTVLWVGYVTSLFRFSCPPGSNCRGAGDGCDVRIGRGSRALFDATFRDDNGNCAGGSRGAGKVRVSIDGNYEVGGALAFDLLPERCFLEVEKPMAPRRVWSIVNTSLPPPPDQPAPPVPPGTLSLEFEYEIIGAETRRILYQFTVCHDGG